jgi:hypothetical protein
LLADKQVLDPSKAKPGDSGTFSGAGGGGSGIDVKTLNLYGSKVVTINQRGDPKIDGAFESLGMYTFDGTAVVEISNKQTSGSSKPLRGRLIQNSV